MKVTLQADFPEDEANVTAATGRDSQAWFAVLDGFGGLTKGRRELTYHLVNEHKVELWWATTLNNGYEIARGAREKDGLPKGYTICATKTLAATPARCYAALTEATQLDVWFGPAHEVDFRDGGFWRNADGNRVSVRKLSAGKTLKLVWEDTALTCPTPVEIKLTPSAAKTGIVVTIDRLQTRAEADGYRKAWGEALNRFKSYVES